MSDKVYLGDGAYAECDGSSLILTTENGRETTNTIVLDPDVWRALVQYVLRLRRNRVGGWEDT